MVSLMIWYLMNCLCEKEVYFTCAGGRECVTVKKIGRESCSETSRAEIFER